MLQRRGGSPGAFVPRGSAPVTAIPLFDFSADEVDTLHTDRVAAPVEERSAIATARPVSRERTKIVAPNAGEPACARCGDQGAYYDGMANGGEYALRCDCGVPLNPRRGFRFAPTLRWWSRSERGIAVVRRVYQIARMPLASGGVTWPALNGNANVNHRERAAAIRAAWDQRDKGADRAAPPLVRRRVTVKECRELSRALAETNDLHAKNCRRFAIGARYSTIPSDDRIIIDSIFVPSDCEPPARAWSYIGKGGGYTGPGYGGEWFLHVGYPERGTLFVGANGVAPSCPKHGPPGVDGDCARCDGEDEDEAVAEFEGDDA